VKPSVPLLATHFSKFFGPFSTIVESVFFPMNKGCKELIQEPYLLLSTFKRVSGALQKPLRLGHNHASMAATLALHGFAGRRLSPTVGVRGRPDSSASSETLPEAEPGGDLPLPHNKKRELPLSSPL